MKRTDLDAAFKALTPINPALAFVGHSSTIHSLDESLDMTPSHKKELWLQLIDLLSNKLGHPEGADSYLWLSASSYIAKTPQELIWLTYQIASHDPKLTAGRMPGVEASPIINKSKDTNAPSDRDVIKAVAEFQSSDKKRKDREKVVSTILANATAQKDDGPLQALIYKLAQGLNNLK